MRKILFALLVTLALSPMAINAQVQEMTVRQTDGSEQLIQISDIGKISFEGQNLVISMKNSEGKTFPLSSLNKLYFKKGDTTSAVNDSEASTEFSVYPNPSTDKIYLKNISLSGQEISIYNIEGQIVKSFIMNSNVNEISVSELQPGVYFIKVDNNIIRFERL